MSSLVICVDAFSQYFTYSRGIPRVPYQMDLHNLRLLSVFELNLLLNFSNFRRHQEKQGSHRRQKVCAISKYFRITRLQDWNTQISKNHLCFQLPARICSMLVQKKRLMKWKLDILSFPTLTNLD